VREATPVLQAEHKEMVMFEEERNFPRAYTVPGIPHKVASALGVQWAVEKATELGSSVSIYVPGKQNLRSDHPAVDALIRRGVPVRTWRERPGGGVIVALWPDEKNLLRAEESGPAAVVAVTWSPRQVLGWAHAKNAEPLGGPGPDLGRGLDPVVAQAVDSLGIVVGQHKTADQRYRATIAKGMTILKKAGFALEPDDLHTHAIGHGWRASNAEILRGVADRINAGRTIQGMKSAPLRDDVLDHWRAEAARASDDKR
jgi:hypothetical protein